MQRKQLTIGLIVCLIGLAFSMQPVADAAVTSSDPAFGTRTIQMNMEGNDVGVLQVLLAEQGYYNGKITGRFDTETKTALTKYQKANGLKADGRVGKQTQAALLRPDYDTTYRVQKGETLAGIAKRFGTTITTLKRLNGLAGDILYAGEKLVIPVRNYAGLQVQLANLTVDKQGSYGIYVKDLHSARSLAINGDRAYTAASTYKVPLNLVLYQRIIDGTVDPDTKLQYTKGDFELGTGVLQGTKPGTMLPLRKLSELSITVSDNIGKNMIERFLGGKPAVAKAMQAMGGKLVPAEGQTTLTSPREMSMYMEKFLAMHKQHPAVMEKLMYDLKHTIYNDRINPLLPANIEIAHKIGTQINVVNDTGIVYHPTKPYIVTFTSQNIKYCEAYPTIQVMSKRIYDLQSVLK